MLQSMRSNLKGTVAIIIVGFLSLILVGGLLQFAGNSGHNVGEVASVDGSIISEIDLLRDIERQRRQLMSQFGDQLPPDFLSNERLRPVVLDNLINYHLLVNAALDGKMTVSDQSLNEFIVSSPQFQTDGRYSPEIFRNWLAGMRYTASGFKQTLKENILAEQVQRLFIDSGFATDAEWITAATLNNQTRDFTWVTLPLGDLQQQITLTEEEIQAFYDDNKEGYLSDEQIAVEYVEVTIDDIADTIVIDDDAIRQQYEQEAAAYQAETRREAAHILIEDKEGADDRIAEIEAALAAGEEFNVLVERYSDDVGSKSTGGVLGFTTGDIFPPEFETALSSLAVGQVSSPVVTDAGTHFIKLLSLKEMEAPAFEEDRQRIEEQMKATQAEDAFIERLDMLKDFSYNAESLAEVATKISDDNVTFTTVRTELFNRANAPDILANSAVNDAVFSDRVIKEGYASDVIEVAEDHAVVVKMIDHQPVRMLTLQEKRSDIEAILKLQKAKSQLVAKAETLRKALEAGESLAPLAEAEGLSVSTLVDSNRDNPEANPELLDLAFSMDKPVEGSPVIGGEHLSNGDYVLISLSKVKDAAIDSLSQTERNNLRNNLARTYATDESLAWRSQLRSNADIEIFTDSDNPGSL